MDEADAEGDRRVAAPEKSFSSPWRFGRPAVMVMVPAGMGVLLLAGGGGWVLCGRRPVVCRHQRPRLGGSDGVAQTRRRLQPGLAAGLEDEALHESGRCRLGAAEALPALGLEGRDQGGDRAVAVMAGPSVASSSRISAWLRGRRLAAWAVFRETLMASCGAGATAWSSTASAALVVSIPTAVTAQQEGPTLEGTEWCPAGAMSAPCGYPGVSARVNAGLSAAAHHGGPSGP